MSKTRIEFIDSEWTEDQALALLDELCEKLGYQAMPVGEGI